MDDQQRNFVRNMVHHLLHSALTSLMWRTPTGMLVVLVGGLVAAIWWFRLY